MNIQFYTWVLSNIFHFSRKLLQGSDRVSEIFHSYTLLVALISSVLTLNFSCLFYSLIDFHFDLLGCLFYGVEKLSMLEYKLIVTRIQNNFSFDEKGRVK